MTDFKHTPGPWEWGKRKFDGSTATPIGTAQDITVRPVGEHPHGMWVADCGRLYDEEAEANARLIAAAPEMAELVAKLARWADGAERNPSFGDDFPVYAYGDVEWTLGELKAARALLARIKGESA